MNDIIGKSSYELTPAGEYSSVKVTALILKTMLKPNLLFRKELNCYLNIMAASFISRVLMLPHMKKVTWENSLEHC